jgi:hypothetical protein
MCNDRGQLIAVAPNLLKTVHGKFGDHGNEKRSQHFSLVIFFISYSTVFQENPNKFGCTGTAKNILLE